MIKCEITLQKTALVDTRLSVFAQVLTKQIRGFNLRAEAAPNSQLRDTGLVLGYAHAQRVCLREHKVRMFKFGAAINLLQSTQSVLYTCSPVKFSPTFSPSAHHAGWCETPQGVELNSLLLQFNYIFHV